MRPLPVRFLLAALLALSSLAAQAEKWRFVVAGDGRSNGANSTRPEDKNGVNTVITAEIRDAVLREKAKALLWTGDLVYGAKEASVFRQQLTTWMEIMNPLWAHGVEVLPVRGNHEMTCPESAAIWDEFFSGAKALPKNGPFNAKNQTYYSIHGSVLFLGIDNYAGGRGTVPLNWLRGVLGKNRFDHVFAFCHEMAFMAGLHTDNLDRNPAERDEFWRLLATSGSRAFFAGHDHLYDHMEVNGEGLPHSIHQYVAGTAGAPFYEDKGYLGNNGTWKLKRVKNLQKTYGYLLVEIDGLAATVTFKGRKGPGQYVPMDVWSYRSGT